MMICGGILIKTPYHENTVTNITNTFSYKTIFKDKFFICSWLFMFLNISPLYVLVVLYVITPFTLVFIGAVYISPSGILH